MRRDGARCFYCGSDLSQTERDQIHIDHFIPVARGGGDDPLNLVVSCSACNLSKSDHLPTSRQIAKLKLNLVKSANISNKEKIILLDRLSLVTSQKEIAAVLDISPSYVSTVLRESTQELGESLTTLYEGLSRVGELPTLLDEPEETHEYGNNGHNPVYAVAQEMET
jgi:DNA-binding CsgD family transcriptional regulator